MVVYILLVDPVFTAYEHTQYRIFKYNIEYVCNVHECVLYVLYKVHIRKVNSSVFCVFQHTTQMQYKQIHKNKL